MCITDAPGRRPGADEGLPTDELGVAFLAACGLADPAALLDAFYADSTRRTWASRAAAVFEVAARGLAHHQPLLVTTVRSQLASLGFDDVRVLAGDPVHGAARLAHALVDRVLAGRA